MLHQNPLHFSCRYGQVEAVKVLIDNGVNAFAKDLRGMTPYDYAKKKKYKDILDILIQVESHGETPEKNDEEKQEDTNEYDK